MQTYDKYKDSGVEWIGEIPEHWDIMKLKYSCRKEPYFIKTGPFGSQLKGEDLKDDGDVRVYSQRNVIDSSFSEVKYYVTNAKAKALKSFYTKSNDVLITSRGTIGKAAMLPKNEENGILHPCLIALRNDNKIIDRNYLLYFINEFNGFKLNIKLESNATTIEVIYTETLKNIRLIVPPLNVQKQIVSYLDKKCADIDKVIATQQRRIELLQELKQSTITHAVTRGLNPNVKMKDSGVEWIGEVPEHWKVMKSSLMSSLIGSGTTPNTNNKDYYCENEEEGYNWLQTGDLNNGLIISTLKKVTLKAVKECNLKFYTTGSIVIAMYGATIGKVGILGFNTAVNQACCVLSKTDKIVSKFVFYLFLSAKESLLISAIGGGQPNISQEVIKKLKVVVPPLSEQRSIATYLDKKCVELDKSISKAQREIDLLQEYKQALITEVVTGKRKVS